MTQRLGERRLGDEMQGEGLGYVKWRFWVRTSSLVAVTPFASDLPRTVSAMIRYI